MYCTHCGNPLPTGAIACPSCATPVPQFAAPPAVPNYLWQSIAVTLCCCMPFGIVAIVFAAQVNTKLAAGDVAGAQVSSRKARTWVIVALVAGLLSGAGAALLTLL